MNSECTINCIFQSISLQKVDNTTQNVSTENIIINANYYYLKMMLKSLPNIKGFLFPFVKHSVKVQNTIFQNL